MEDKPKDDTYLLLKLLNSLKELDVFSDEEAINEFEKLIEETIEEVGYDRLNEWFYEEEG